MTPAREQELLAEISRLRTELERSRLENQLLREKINLMTTGDSNYQKRFDAEKRILS